MERLEVGEIFSWILLRLLCNQKRKFQIVYAERGIIELINICKKANMLGGSFGERILGC
jgi:hypothetical protein